MASETRMTAYTVREYEQNGEQRSYWTKIGSCFENKDGSLNVYLDALPVGNKIHIRAKQVTTEDMAIADLVGANADELA